MNRLIGLKYLLLTVIPVIMFSCSKKEEPLPEEKGVPAITFVSGTDERRVKPGESVTLTAVVENAEQPVFTWIIDGRIMSTEASFTFVSMRTGEYFVNFRVDAANGSGEEQVKISVLEVLPPKITLGATSIAYAGIDKVFAAEAENAEGATYVWRLNGQIVSEASTYTFNRREFGDYLMSLKVTTADGQDLKNITVSVLPEQLPELFFDDGRYRTTSNAADLRKMTVPAGKTLVLAPVICNIANPSAFEWKVDGAVQSATGEYFSFAPAAQGAYRVSVTEKSTGATAEVEVTCTPPEGTHRRTGGAKANATQAFDYGPAPGQFIDYQKGVTKTKAMDDLQAWCDRGAQGYFMIGAFGGYYMLGFDHSVNNVEGKADLQVAGNAFAGWCEPGIVWVMQDDNGNGLPDDTWYELKGSETGKPETKQRCAITYYKPNAPYSNTLWTDNIGRSGSIDWIGAHPQQYYFPMFIAEDYYTLVGTCLNSTFGIDGGLETSSCYNWGYVDNIGNEASRPSAQFWIEDAIQADGSPANLKYIDFIKVHTATIGKGAAVGEISTEAVMPLDLNF